MMRLFGVGLVILASCEAFVQRSFSFGVTRVESERLSVLKAQKNIFDPFRVEVTEEQPSSLNIGRSAAEVALVSSVFLLVPAESWALDGPFSILAGRTASMLHPVTNLALFGTSIYSAYLGLQWKRLRQIGEELKDLNKQLPKLSSGPAKSPLSETRLSIVSEMSSLAADDAKRVALQKDLALIDESTEIDTKIATLSATRKQLISMDLRDKHHLTGSVLLGVGVGVSLLGCLNTYLRAGKLYPGPHLFAGAAITGFWAAAAALVPLMTKGNEGARAAHIALNTINIALFAWQVGTGLDIMVKVFEHTSWP